MPPEADQQRASLADRFWAGYNKAWWLVAAVLIYPAPPGENANNDTGSGRERIQHFYFGVASMKRLVEVKESRGR